MAGVANVGTSRGHGPELALLVAPRCRRLGVGSYLARLAHQVAGQPLIGSIGCGNVPARRLLHSVFPFARTGVDRDAIIFVTGQPSQRRDLDLTSTLLARDRIGSRP